jgi:hypothetical protein
MEVLSPHAAGNPGGQRPAARPGGQQHLDPRRGAPGVDDAFQHGERDAHRCPPGSATASASVPGCRAAVMSPSRWEQVIPAACVKVAAA